MNRIMVVGNMATGKSTFAKKLQQKLGIDTIHLDALFFRPNCEFTPKEEWHEIVKSLAEKDNWIIDGNYPNTLNIRAEKADTILIFNYSRWLCYRNFIKRNILNYFTKELPNDRPKYKCDKLSFKSLKRIWIFKSKTIKYYSDFYKMEDKNIYVFNSPKDADLFFNSIV